MVVINRTPITMSQRWLLILQFWLTAFRLINAVCGSVLVVYQMQFLDSWRRNPPRQVQSYVKVPTNINSSVFTILSLQLGLWIALVANDIYISTLDFKWTQTYIGCAVVQASMSAISVIISVAAIAFWMTCGWKDTTNTVAGFNKSIYYQPTDPPFLSYILPMILGVIWSLCLLVLVAVASLPHRNRMQVWKYNTKDLIMSQNQSYGQPPTLSFAGRRRSENIRTASELHAPGNILRRFLANVLFRRVSPAETRTYAITRNAFSIISLGALMFRVVTALQKAQNELGTRIVSDNCDKSIPSDRIDVISDVVNFPLRRPQVQITVNGTRAQGSGVCTPQGNLSILFTCEPNGQRLPGPTENNYYRPTFYFEVLSTGGALNEADMPSFWLINRGERFSSAEASVIANDPSVGLAAWLYTPSWQLRPGFHIEAEAQSVTRRFLTSSIIQDILLSSEPTYARTNLFPIGEYINYSAYQVV
ncbi:unnamed protein product [Rhizoctonia solani]|uniref:Uncharacterized protein n=1 Tax=Rhizoctonia solani TaxID=456999 RepID=A0A8H2ZU86_9AGAM|nr:unnamed protein product [Rhizoctonia solani]